MPVTLTEYLRDFRGDPSKARLKLYGNVDDSAFGFVEAVMATLYYEGKEINKANVTAGAIAKIEGFYRKSPLEANDRLDQLVASLTRSTAHPLDASKAIFDWIVGNVRYGAKKRGAVGYRTSLETFATGEGVCGEMAILFVAMAGLAGIPSAYVSVRTDMKNRDVRHACASVYDHGSDRPILIDLSYRKFGVEHRKYEFLDHKELERHFVVFRGRDLSPGADSERERLQGIFPD